MAKTFKNVPEMVNAHSDDKDFNQKLQEEISAKQMGKILFALRCHRGLSQAEMAALMKCSQSRISKIEHSYDDSVSLGDMTAYARALDLQLSVYFHKESNAVESIKYHAFQIRNHLKHLTGLAGGDAKMLVGVTKFYREAIVNIAAIFAECASKLPAEHREHALMINADPSLLGITEDDTADDEHGQLALS